MLWHQIGFVNTGWTVQVRGPIPEEHQRQGVLVWTSNRQPQQTASYHLGMTRTKTALIPRFQKCSQVVLIGWHGQRVSKAALRSNSASIDTSFSSDFVRRPSSTLKTAVSVLWYFLYADCRISSKLFAHRWDCSWRTTFSSIFERNGRFETGLKFLKSLASRPCFLSMGITRACFNPDGTVPVDKETLTILVTRGARSCRHCLVRVVGMGSRVQLFVGDWEMSLQISSCVTGSDMDNWGPSNLKKDGGSWGQE